MRNLFAVCGTALLAVLAVAAPASPAAAQASASPFTAGYRYDAMRRLTGTIAADPDGVGTGNPFLAVRNSYDAAGRLTKVETGTLSVWQSEAVAPSAWPNFAAFRTVETSYDAMGRKTRDSVRDGAVGTVRSVTQYSYDAAGRLDCTAVRMNPADFASPPASACTQGTGGADRITRTIYDLADQRLQLREGVGSSIEATEATWAYNQNGQVTTVIDGNGNRAALVYDGHARQTCWMFPSTTRPSNFDDTTQVSALATAGALSGTITGGQCASGDFERYSYDAGGNRTQLRKRDERRIEYAYDALNRVTAKTYPDGGATAVHYAYDLRNLQLHARFGSQSGEGITNAYDGFGRLASSSTNMGGVTRTLAYQYDRNSNRTRITHPDGTFFDTTYDGLNRPFYIDNWRIWFAYKHHGAPYAAIRANGVNDFWEYDGAQRLYSHGLYFNAPHAGSTAIWLYTHNPAPQLASVWRDNDAYAWPGAYNAARPYATNGLNQYSVAGPPNTAGSVAFTYDANGNLASETPWGGATTSYTYDIENRLVGRSGGVTLSYDPLGRLFEVSGAITTRFLYDGDALVAEYVSGAMTRRYVHNVGADVPLLSYAGSGLTQPQYLHTDHQGSIVAVSDAVGAGTVNSYDEYGIPGAGNSGRFQYTGQIWLDEIGMYHYKARIYSPTLGRFLQTDPIGYEDQFNLYAYVGNDPVNMTDPSGQCGKGHFRLFCKVTYGPQTREADPQSASMGDLNRHLKQGRGRPIYFDPEHWELGQHDQHGITVNRTISGLNGNRPLYRAFQQSRAERGRAIPVNFVTRDTAWSAMGNYTILWKGTITAQHGRYTINVTGTVADSQFDWNQDSDNGTGRDQGVMWARLWFSCFCDREMSFTLRPTRPIVGVFSGTY